MISSVRGSFSQRLNENIVLRQIIFFEFFVNDWSDPHMNNFSTFGLEKQQKEPVLPTLVHPDYHHHPNSHRHNEKEAASTNGHRI